MKCSKCKINEKSYHHRIYCQKCKSEIDLKSYHKNKDKRKNWKKQWLLNNPEKKESYQIQTKKWLSNNPNYMNNWMKEKRKNDNIFKLKHHLQTQIHTYLKKYTKSKSKKSLEIVGLDDWNMLKEHIEKQFTEGMNWENWGIGKDNTTWHIDHIIPISSAKTEEEIYKLNHYTNLRPMWGSDNIKKSNKPLEN